MWKQWIYTFLAQLYPKYTIWLACSLKWYSLFWNQLWWLQYLFQIETLLIQISKRVQSCQHCYLQLKWIYTSFLLQMTSTFPPSFIIVRIITNHTILQQLVINEPQKYIISFILLIYYLYQDSILDFQHHFQTKLFRTF